ncbi:MAG TPA: response regulator [Thermoanaerobaculia bacterium]
MTARVLVVDDDDPIRRLMARALIHAGYETAEARNGEEALSYIVSGDQADVVLLDLMMPVKSGFDFIERLRSERPECLGRVIVVTAASQYVTRHLDRRGLFAILEKPFDIGQLIRTVSDCAASLEH